MSSRVTPCGYRKILQDKESVATRFAFPSANLIVLKSMTLDLSKETLTIIFDKI